MSGVWIKSYSVMHVGEEARKSANPFKDQQDTTRNNKINFSHIGCNYWTGVEFSFSAGTRRSAPQILIIDSVRAGFGLAALCKNCFKKKKACMSFTPFTTAFSQQLTVPRFQICLGQRNVTMMKMFLIEIAIWIGWSAHGRMMIHETTTDRTSRNQREDRHFNGIC